MEVKIKNQNELIDATIEMVDGIMVVSPKELFKPKDGEVVYVSGYNKYVFIYKDEITEEAYYYVAFSINKERVEFPDGGHIGYISQLRPATEEEKQLLFDKLAEEGWDWDAEKKQLVKLKWKPKLVGEDYYNPSFNEFEFEPYLYGWDEDEIDFKLYEMGWVFKTKEECQSFCDRLNKAIEEVKP